MARYTVGCIPSCPQSHLVVLMNSCKYLDRHTLQKNGCQNRMTCLSSFQPTKCGKQTMKLIIQTEPMRSLVLDKPYVVIKHIVKLENLVANGNYD